MRFVVGLLVGTALGAVAVRFLRPQTTLPAALRGPSGQGSTPDSGPVVIDVTDAPPEPA